MKHLIPILAVAGGLHAAEFDPARVAADAKWWLHLDAEAARDSEIGAAVAERIEDEHGAKLRALERMFSLHLVDDLAGVTLSGNGEESEDLVWLEADFDRAHLEDIVAAADDYENDTVAGRTVHSWVDKEKPQNAVFLRGDLLVFSHSRERLVDALGAERDEDPVEAPEVEEGTILLMGSARLGEMELEGEESKLLGRFESLDLALFENDERVHARIEAAPDRALTAELAAKVLEGIIALGQLTDERLAEADLDFETEVAEGGRRLDAHLSLPAKEMIEWMDERKVLAELDL